MSKRWWLLGVGVLVSIGALLACGSNYNRSQDGLLLVGSKGSGLIETFSAVFLSSAYKDGIGMLLLIAILLFMPSGLVGLWQKRW